MGEHGDVVQSLQQHGASFLVVVPMHNSPTSRAPVHNTRKRPGADAGQLLRSTGRQQRCAHDRDVHLAASSPPAGLGRRQCRRMAPVARRRGLGGRRRRQPRRQLRCRASVTTTGPDASGGGTPTSLPTPAPQAAAVVDAPAVSGGPGASESSVQQTIACVHPARALDRLAATETVALSQLRGFNRGLPFYPGPALARDRGGCTWVTRRLAGECLVAGRRRRDRRGSSPTPACAHRPTRPRWWRGIPTTSCEGSRTRAPGSVAPSRCSSPPPRGVVGPTATPPTSRSSSRGGTLPAQVTASLAVAVH